MRGGGGVLEGVRADLAAEAEANVAGGRATWFLGVRASIQKVDRGDSLLHRRHQFRADFRELGPVSVTDPLAVHLKDICHWEGRIIDPMLDLQRGA